MSGLTNDQRQLLEQAVVNYQANVNRAGQYLEGRGIPWDVAWQARLGVVVTPQQGHEDMVGRLAIPFLTLAGPVDIRFRCVTQHGTDEHGAPVKCKDLGHGKYLSLPGHSPRLYNASALSTDSDTVAVCEGEFDTLIVHHHLHIPAVGVAGVQMWSGQKHYPRMFRGFRKVLVFADADDAGKDLGKQILRDIPHAVVVRLADGMDTTDTYLLEGVAGLAERAGLL